MGYKTNFWGAIIVANVANFTGHSLAAIVWTVFAIGILIWGLLTE